MAPVLRISADGQSTTLFDVSNAPEIKEAASYEIYDFAIRKDGTILELAALTTKDQQSVVAVIQIDGDDKSISLTHIDSSLVPRQIVPLPNGSFFCLESNYRVVPHLVDTPCRKASHL